MSTLRELDASAEAAEACERAAVSLKRATRDVEASARGRFAKPHRGRRTFVICAPGRGGETRGRGGVPCARRR